MPDSERVPVWIGLGANLGDPAQTIQAALDQLHEHPDVHALVVSSLYRSEPVGYDAQPDFFNAVARFETDLKPLALLEMLLDLESALGRTRSGPRFGPRVIDLDLLLYGDATIESARLSIPHPRMLVRRFVLEPLAELEGDMIFPDGSRLLSVVRRCKDQRVSQEAVLSVDPTT